MGASIYRSPIRSAILINIFALWMSIGSILDSLYEYPTLLIIIGVINKRIVDKGQNIDQRKKTIIYSSFFLTIIIIFIFAIFMHNVRYN